MAESGSDMVFSNPLQSEFQEFEVEDQVVRSAKKSGGTKKKKKKKANAAETSEKTKEINPNWTGTKSLDVENGEVGFGNPVFENDADSPLAVMPDNGVVPPKRHWGSGLRACNVRVSTAVCNE